MDTTSIVLLCLLALSLLFSAWQELEIRRLEGLCQALYQQNRLYEDALLREGLFEQNGYDAGGHDFGGRHLN